MDNRARSVLEKEVMAPLKAGGFFRSMKLTKAKLDQLHIDRKKAIPERGMMKRLAHDGVWCADPTLKMKFKNANVQRLEERLLRERPKTPEDGERRNN